MIIFARVSSIVVSILVAFALDAWWGYQTDRIQEGEIIEGLTAEFEANRLRLTRDIEFVESYAEASQRLLAVAYGLVDPPPADSVARFLWHSMSWRTTNVGTATLDATLGRGSLDLIRDDSLRVALAGWPSVLEDSAEEEIFEWREVTERYRPLVGRYFPIPLLESSGSPPTPDPADLARLLKSVEFQSALAMRVDVALVALKDKVETLQELDRILGLLRRNTS